VVHHAPPTFKEKEKKTKAKVLLPHRAGPALQGGKEIIPEQVIPMDGKEFEDF
jgi:hypothetical protein